jgi:hypothetical protein
VAAITLGATTESLVLDFKRSLSKEKKEWQKELCRDLAQFANTDGGTMIIGVDEQSDPITNLKVAKSIVPVDDPEQCRQWIEQAIPQHLVPSTLTHDVCFIHTSDGVIVAVNVAPSRATVYLWSNKRDIECLYRTNHGKAYMNPDEMERHGMNSLRSVKLAFRSAIARSQSPDVELVGGIVTRTPLQPVSVPFVMSLEGPIRLASHDDYSFRLYIPLPGIGILGLDVPFELCRAAWTDIDGKLQILPHHQVVFEQPNRRLTFDCFGLYVR